MSLKPVKLPPTSKSVATTVYVDSYDDTYMEVVR